MPPELTGIAAIGSGAKSQIGEIGTIDLVASGTSRRFKLASLDAQKRLLLDFNGAVDVTGAGGAVRTLGPLEALRGIRLLVKGQPGPFAVNGQALYLMALKDYLRAPYLAVPADAAIADDKAFQTVLPVDFALPKFDDGDATILKTKVDATYELEVDFGASSDIISGGANHFANNAIATKVDVIAQEISGLARGSNLYNKTFTRTDALAVNSQLRIPLDLAGGFLNELFFLAYTAAGALSDAVINRIWLRNGSKRTFHNLSWARTKRVGEQLAGLPSTLPTGMAFIDLSANDEFKSMVNADEYKELELIVDVAAAGSLVTAIRMITPPVPGD